MGLYAIDCPECKKPFMWFSGNMPDQRCGECKDSALKKAQQAENTPEKLEIKKQMEERMIEISAPKKL